MSKKQADSPKSPSKSGAKLQIKKEKKEKDKMAQEKSPKQKDKKQKEQKKQKKEEKEAKEEKKDKGKKDKMKNSKENKSEENGQEVPLKKSQSKQNQKDHKQSKDKKKDKDEKKKDKDEKNKDKDEKKKDKDEKKKDKNKKQAKQQSPAVAATQNSNSKNQVSLISKNIDKELDTIQSIHKSQDKTKITIQDLIKQYKSAAQAMLFSNHGHDPQKEREIQKHLQTLQKEKENRRKKIEDLDKQKQEIFFTKEKQKETKKQLRYQKIREKKIKKIEEKLSNLSISAEERRKQYTKFLQYVNERRKFQPRFKKYEQQFQQGLQQDQQSYRQRLQQIVKKYQPMNKNELDHFQENYSLQKQQTGHYRANKIKLEQDIIKEENERARSKLWKGQCHKNVNEEIQLLLEIKKKPKQKLQAMKEYGKIAAQFMGKQEKQQQQGPVQVQAEDKEVENKFNQNMHYHQKYFKGVNYGLVPVQIVTPISIEEKNQLGRAYLKHVKQRNLASINKSKTVDHDGSKKLDDSRELKNKSQTFKVKRVSNPYYASPNNRKSLDFNNYQAIEYSIDKIGSLSNEKKLQDQIIRHGQYGGILQIHEKKAKIGSLLVKQINDKLDLLNKL